VQPVILGTDVASLLHRRKLTGPLATRLIGREPLITFITFGELAKWAEIRRWGAHRRGKLAGWLFDPRRRSRAHWTPECSGHRHRRDRHPTAQGPTHLQQSAACATT